LFETRFVASSALQELDQERQVRHRCSDAYNELHIQYGRKVAELHEMTTKCLSLHNQLEEAQNTISDYNSTFKESESRVAAEKAQLEDTIKDLEERRAKRAQQIQAMIEDGNSARRKIDELEKELNKTLAREGPALQKIDKLEKEKEHLIQGHRAEINMMVARESLGVQRIDELQKGMDELIQEHQAAIDIAVDRMNSAEQKVDEFRKIMGTSEHQRAASTCLTPSPELSPRAVKRPRSETKQQRGRPSKHRKCKDAPKVGDGDSIVVEWTD
jgi:chromosome segregation ATPase